MFESFKFHEILLNTNVSFTIPHFPPAIKSEGEHQHEPLVGNRDPVTWLMLVKSISILQQLSSPCVLLFEHLNIFVSLHVCSGRLKKTSSKDDYGSSHSLTPPPPCPPSPFSLPLLSLILWKRHLLLTPGSAAVLGCSAHLCVSLADLQSKHTETSSLQRPLRKIP